MKIGNIGSGVVALGLICLLQAPRTLADDSKRGRLPDGTAFRTDAAGSQLVDYVAELEVTVEELQRRVRGLEDELDEHKKDGGAPKGPIVERNLGPAGAAPDKAAPENPAPLAVESPRSDAWVAELSTCRVSLSSCEHNLDTVKRQIAATRVSAETKPVVNEPAQPDLRPQVSKLQQLLVEKESLLAKKDGLLAQKENTLQATEVELARVRGAAELRVAASRAARAPIVAAPEASAPLMQAPAAERVDARASLDVARLQALQAMKGKLHTEYNRLQTLIRSRDSLYERFRTTDQDIQFHPAPADGSELGKLSSGIDSAQDSGELSTIAARLAELRGRIEADVGLMQRVLRNR